MQQKVNRPTDVAHRDQTIDQKLQLYGIYSAFSQGKLPSNDQIDIALNSALQSRALSKPSDRLSDEGHKLVADLADVIEKAKVLLLSKNQGQLIQEFIWNVDRTGRSLSQNGKANEKTQGPLSKDAAQQDGRDALEGLKTLAKLIVTNGQFRKLLSDASILARSMVGDAASGIAGRVHPSDEQLSQIDTPAEDNSWVEAPDFDQSDFKTRLKSQYSKASSSWAKKKRPGSSDSSGMAGEGIVDDTPALPDDGATAVSNASSRRKEWGDKAKGYWSKKMPAERQEATMDRLRKMIVEIQGHADYQNAIVTLLNLLDTYGGHGRHYSTRGYGQAEGVYKSDEVQAAEKNLKTVIERFANSTSMDDFFDSVKNIKECAQTDDELRNWLHSLNTYFRRCLRETGYVIQPEAKEEWRALSEHGQQLTRHKYRPEFKRLSHEAQSFVKQFDADPANKAFGQSVQKLCLDLGQDENGKPKFKPHLVKDLTTVIIPAFLEHLHYVPLPRMEYSDKTIDLIFENLVIESDNLTPNMLEFKSDNHWRWGRGGHTGGNKNKLLLCISGIQMDLRDVSYHLNKKAGFPKLTDTGLMDVFLGGNGLSVLIEMETADRFSPNSKSFGGDGGLTGGAHYFRASQVKVDLSTLKIKVHKSNHKFLISIMKPILLRLLKPIVGRVAASQAKKAIAELDDVLYEIRNEAKRAREAEKTLTPDQRAKQATYSRYMELIKDRYQSKKEAAKAKAKEVNPSEGKFQFVVTEDHTMFPKVKLPPGISSKTMAYRDRAAQGSDWNSPVFSLGSAQKTSSGKIPTVPKVVRKSTWTGYQDPKHNDSTAANKTGPSSVTAMLDGRTAGANVNPTMSPSDDVRRHPLREVDNEQGLPMDQQTYQRATDPTTYSHVGNDGGRFKENEGDNNRYHRDSKMDKNLRSGAPEPGHYQSANTGGQDMNHPQGRPYTDVRSYNGHAKVPAYPSTQDGTYGNGKFHRYGTSNNQAEGSTPMHMTAAEKMAAATLGLGAAEMGGAAYRSHGRSKSGSKDYGSDYGSNTSVPITGAGFGSVKSDGSSSMTPSHPSDGESAPPSAAETSPTGHSIGNITDTNTNITSIQRAANPQAVATNFNTVPAVPVPDIPNSQLDSARSFPGRTASPTTSTERVGGADKGHSFMGISPSGQQATSAPREVGSASSGPAIDPMATREKSPSRDASIEDDGIPSEVVPGTLPASIPATPNPQSSTTEDEAGNKSGVVPSNNVDDTDQQPTATSLITQALYSVRDSVRDRLSGSYQAAPQEPESQHSSSSKSNVEPPSDGNMQSLEPTRGANDAAISEDNRWGHKARDSAHEGLTDVRVVGNENDH